MKDSLCRQIVILGDSVEGWCAAAYLAKLLQPLPVTIRLIKLPSEPLDDSIISLPPSTHLFHQTIGISIKQLIEEAAGGFNLGVRLKSQSTNKPSFFVPYSDFGQSKGFFEFHQVLQRLDNLSENIVEEFSLSYKATAANRFGIPTTDAQRNPLQFGLEVKQASYKKLIAQQAFKLNVDMIESSNVELQCTDDGMVSAVNCDQGQSFSVDLLLDCRNDNVSSSFDVKDVAAILDSESAPSDRTTEKTLPLSRQHDFYPFGCIKTHVINGQAHRKFLLNDENSSLGALKDSPKLEQTSISNLSVGFLSNCEFNGPWQNNVIQLNANAIRFPEIHCEFFEFFIAALFDLSDLLPSRQTMAVNSKEFNRLCRNRFDQINDFHDLIMNALRLHQEESWQGIFANDYSNRLKHNTQLFRTHGRLNLKPDEYIRKHHYIAVLIGSGQLPDDYHPLLDVLDQQDLANELTALKNAQQAFESKLPDYHAFLQQLAR